MATPPLLLLLLLFFLPNIHASTPPPPPPSSAINLTLLPPYVLTLGAVCLDGTAPGFHFDKGSGSGINSWLLHLAGGAWCSTNADCLARSQTVLGSSNYMAAVNFTGHLSSSPIENPGFYNWNRVFIRYCDGASFSGNVDEPVRVKLPESNQTRLLHYRGQRIWDAMMDYLLSKSMVNATEAVLSGDSAGGLAAFHHCNQFKDRLPTQTNVACLCDGGFFLDLPNITGQHFISSFFRDVVTLQNVTILPARCTQKMDPSQCFFPQYTLEDINTPLFFLQSSYDTWQLRNVLGIPLFDANWTSCMQNFSTCSHQELLILQGFHTTMLAILGTLKGDQQWGMHVVSCFVHIQELDDYYWNGSIKVNNMTSSYAFMEWYFGHQLVQNIDCAYPCNKACLFPS